MKQLTLISLTLIIALGFLSCGSGNKSKQLNSYKYSEDKSVLKETLQKKVGGWIKEGMTCYGIVILNDKDGTAKKVKEIEAKVIAIQPEFIKMKANEELILAAKEGCTKTGMKKGETWEEKEGDLFQTREEAIKFIDTNYPETQLIIK